MLHSIRARLILAVIVMAALLGALIYFTSIQMKSIDEVLANLEALQDVKTHVMAPQKDMNQFIAALDSTVLFIQLGDQEAAQAAFDSSVDAEQDIAGEFEYLEKNTPEELLDQVGRAHLNWEIATEFMKYRAEVLAKESGMQLTRPATTEKVMDVHSSTEAVEGMEKFQDLGFETLTGVYQDREASPVEAADEGIDGSDEAVSELLEAERAAGDKAVKNSANTVMLGSLGVLLAIMLVGAVVTTSVSRPLSSLKGGVERIADGDLDYTFENVPDDEVGAVITSVEKMAGGLKGRIRNLEEVAGVVLVTAEEIGVAAEKAKADGADMDVIIAKAGQLNELVGPMLADAKK